MSHKAFYILFGLSISLNQVASKQPNFFTKPPPFYQPLPHIIVTLGVPKIQDSPYSNFARFPNFADLLGQPPRTNFMRYQSELTGESPEHSGVEILETIGYTLPSEITFNHPVTYAKEYLLDTASSDFPASHSADLLTGELRENEEILTEVETKNEEKHANRYYFSSSTSNASVPKNTYEVISPEEDAPTEENSTEKEEEEEDESENDTGLEVLGLENRSDQLLFLLPSKGTGAPRAKRNANDSFNVNIGAGYGVGIDQDATHLPDSTTQINSTNPLKSLLRGEHVVVGKYPKKQEFHAESKVLMGMNEIQQILRNVENDSGYSKIVQVVKVPAVYEIHLEKQQTSKKPARTSENNVVYGTNKYRPAPRKVRVKTNFREKKNTPYPMNHQSYYKPEYVPYYPPARQHPVYTTLTSRVPFIDKRAFSHVTNKIAEKNINPDEISITIQPGTTMVTVPKADAPQDRNFLEHHQRKPCDKGRKELGSPPELNKATSNVDNVYFTTLKPLEKERYFKADRRNGARPIKYMLYINKIITDTW